MSQRIGEYMSAEFAGSTPSGKTKIWRVLSNNGGILGHVKWFGRWRQYCFDPSSQTTFNRCCLQDLAAFLEQVNERHREGLKAAA